MNLVNLELENTFLDLGTDLVVFDNTNNLPVKIIDMKDRFLKMVISVYNETSFSRKKILEYLKKIIDMFKENLNILLSCFDNSTVDLNTKNEIKSLIQIFSNSCVN